MGGGGHTISMERCTSQRALPGISTMAGDSRNGSARTSPPRRCPDAMCKSRRFDSVKARWQKNGKSWVCWHCGEVVK